MLSRMLSALVCAGLFFFALESGAAALSIEPKEGSGWPSSIVPESSGTLYYTVTNTSSRDLTGIFVKDLPLNATQVTSGGTYDRTCGATFDLNYGDSCTLQLSVTGIVDPTGTSRFLKLCLSDRTSCIGTKYNFNLASLVSIELVSPPTSIPLWDATKRFTLEGHYLNGAREPLLSSLTWNSSNTSVATLVAVGEGEDPSFSGTMNVYAMFHPRALGSTNITATYGSLTSSPVTVTVKPSYAYIANRGGNSVTICRVNTDHDYTDEESYTEGDEDGDLIECAAHTDRSFSEPIDLTLNADRTKIYVVNYSNNTVSLCSLTNGGAGMGSCSVQSLLDNGVNPSGIILSNRIPTIAYVSYKEPTGFATCDVASTGGLSGCVSHTSSGSARIYNPNIADVTLAENLGSYYIYFASYGDSLHHGIIGCRFHEGSQTKIERCFGVGRGDHLEASKIYFNEPQSIDFNEDYTEYYVQNSGNDTVGYCVNDVCRYYPSSGQAFSFTAGEKSGLFRSSDSYLYVTNSANNTVSKCLMTNGVIVSCTATSNSSTFNVPSDIVIGVGT